MGRPKSTLTKAIEDRFSDAVRQDDGGYFECLACLSKVKCVGARGAPGRLNHLKVHHPAVLAEIIGQNPKAKRQRREKVTEGSSSDGGGEAGGEVSKRSDRRAEADFFARQLFPFTVADDPYFEGRISRKTIVTAILERQKEKLGQFFADNKGLGCTLSLDSGTNAGTRTVNICCCFGGGAVLLSARRIEVHTGQNIADAVEEIIAPPFSLKICAFVGDNAANVKSAISTLASKRRCMWFCCACHAINQIVKKIAWTWKTVDDSRKFCDLLREGGAPVPQEIDTRWTGMYDAVSFVVQHGASLVFDGKARHSDVQSAKEAQELLKPFYVATLESEKDSSTVFDAVSAIGSCLNDSVTKDQIFLEAFQRNVYCNTIVAACALSPTWSPELAIKPIQAMVTEVLVELIDLTAPPGSDGEKLCHERATQTQISLLMSGALQKIWRLAEVKKADVWAKGETPKIEELFCQLQNCSASSATVERSFSAHAKAQTKQRTSVGETNISAQLSLHSILKVSSGQFSKAFPKEAAVERVLMSAVQCRCLGRSDGLKSGDAIVVWFETNHRLTPYRGKLIEQTNNNSSSLVPLVKIVNETFA